MELWRTEVIEGRRPAVLSAATLCAAVVLHLLAFAVFWVVAVANGLFEKKEVIVPIDLSVVVNENLDGVEGEPPPLVNPAPPEPPKPPEPKPKPRPKPEKPKPEPPKPLEQIVTNVVKQTEQKKPPKKEDPPKKDPPKKDEPKKDEPKKDEPKKKPEPPKKTKAQLRQERLDRIRSGTKTVNKPVAIEVKDAKASGNGKTARQTRSRAEIERMLNQGYRPGTENRVAESEEQRCLSLIQMAIEDRWDAMKPKVGRDGTVVLQVRFNSAGGFSEVRLQSGCGDALSDQAALSVARAVTSIRGLSAEFVAKFRREPLTVRYNVRGR